VTQPARLAASPRLGGWLRPVQLCLATTVRGPDGRVWPHPASFVWRSVEEDQRRRREALEALLEPTSSVTTEGPVLAVYRITTADHRQTGVLADVEMDAYASGRIKGHEHTRHEKEEALLAELDAVEALVGPVALAHHPRAGLTDLLEELSSGAPTAAWTTADEAHHELWVVEGERLAALAARCAELDPLYIVDGHHRIAAAARRAAARRGEGAQTGPGDPWGSFLAAVFPADQLQVRATHRVVDLAGTRPETVLERLAALGSLSAVAGAEEARPRRPREFGAGLGGRWFRLEGLAVPERGVPYPDVQALDDLVLGPVLGVDDPRTDPRIDFLPDLGDLGTVAERSREGRAVALLVRPVTVEEVFAVADAGAALPPKSTWFDPKPIKGAVMPEPRLPRRPVGS
jgi:uncharacterized protein (DUF1015 family)